MQEYTYITPNKRKGSYGVAQEKKGKVVMEFILKYFLNSVDG